MCCTAQACQPECLVDCWATGLRNVNSSSSTGPPNGLCRYNETALQRDVEEAMRGLDSTLRSCDLIFMHAPGSNAQQLLGGEVPLLDRADLRLRRVPFTTRRPTLSEAQRVIRHLFQPWAVEEPPQQQEEESCKEAAVAAAADLARREAQQAAAASRAAEQAAAEAAAEEEVRQRRAEKRARQKAAAQQARRAAKQEEAASQQQAAAAAGAGEVDEISAAAAQVVAVGSKLEARPAPVSSSSKASGARLASKPKAGEDAALRRARMAAAAEQRMQSLSAAMAHQKLH